jgi:hypothetical protein
LIRRLPAFSIVVMETYRVNKRRVMELMSLEEDRLHVALFGSCGRRVSLAEEFVVKVSELEDELELCYLDESGVEFFTLDWTEDGFFPTLALYRAIGAPI